MNKTADFKLRRSDLNHSDLRDLGKNKVKLVFADDGIVESVLKTVGDA